MSAIVLGGRYQITGELGKGGFGKTFLAQDRQLPGHPQCVVKQLKPTHTDARHLQVARRLFATEAEVLYKLGNHDRIPQLFAHFEENREFYLVQEFIPGYSLSQEIVVGKQLSEDRVIDILRDILTVLEFVHQQRVIHRDIKPANLIRRQNDGKIVLIDFGAVKQVSTQTVNSQGQTIYTVAIGSEGYMPCEQFAGEPNFSSDIYAVGMIAIQAVTGLHPKQLFQEKDSKTNEIIWRDRAQVSPGLAYILDKMVRFDFRQRYQTANSVIAELKNLSFYNGGMIASITSVRKTTSTTANYSDRTQTQEITKIIANSSVNQLKNPGILVKIPRQLKLDRIWVLTVPIFILTVTQVYIFVRQPKVGELTKTPGSLLKVEVAPPSPSPAEAITEPSTDSPKIQVSISPVPVETTPSLTEEEKIKAQESKAISIITTINKWQGMFHAEHNRFASNWEELKVGLPAQSEDYEYEVFLTDKRKSVATARAKKPGLKSFSGAVFIDGELAVNRICETNEALNIAPRSPDLIENDLKCPYGSTTVSGLF